MVTEAATISSAENIDSTGINELNGSMDGGTGALSEALPRLAELDVAWVMSQFVQLAIPAVVALLGLLFCYFVAKTLARWISRPICKRVDETLGRFTGKFVFYGLMVCASVGIASSVGLNVTSFAAVIAAAGFAIGMAFQGTLSNFAAGILLLVFRPFKVGDVISAAGITGKVNEIDLFTTIVDTPDNRRIIVPNSSISGGMIENVTYHPERRVEIRVGVSYGADVEATRAALSGAVGSLEDLMVRGENRGYAIILDSLGASSVDWLVRFWTPSSKFWETKERLTIAIKRELDLAGISIPYPQLDVHLEGLDMTEMLQVVGDSGATRVRPRLRERPASQNA